MDKRIATALTDALDETDSVIDTTTTRMPSDPPEQRMHNDVPVTIAGEYLDLRRTDGIFYPPRVQKAGTLEVDGETYTVHEVTLTRVTLPQPPASQHTYIPRDIITCAERFHCLVRVEPDTTTLRFRNDTNTGFDDTDRLPKPCMNCQTPTTQRQHGEPLCETCGLTDSW